MSIVEFFSKKTSIDELKEDLYYFLFCFTSRHYFLKRKSISEEDSFFIALSTNPTMLLKVNIIVSSITIYIIKVITNLMRNDFRKTFSWSFSSFLSKKTIIFFKLSFSRRARISEFICW